MEAGKSLSLDPESGSESSFQTSRSGFSSSDASATTRRKLSTRSTSSSLSPLPIRTVALIEAKVTTPLPSRATSNNGLKSQTHKGRRGFAAERSGAAALKVVREAAHVHAQSQWQSSFGHAERRHRRRGRSGAAEDGALEAKKAEREWTKQEEELYYEMERKQVRSRLASC